MSFEVLSQKVQQHAKLLAEEENSQKAIELSNLKKESQTRIENFKKINVDSLEKEKILLEKAILGSAKSTSKSEILVAKETIMKKINFEVLDYFDSLSQKEKSIFYSHLLKRGSDLIEVDQVLCSRKDQKIIESILRKGVKTIIDPTIENGIICESSKSKQRVDLRVKNILDSIISEKENEIQTSLGGL